MKLPNTTPRSRMSMPDAAQQLMTEYPMPRYRVTIQHCFESYCRYQWFYTITVNDRGFRQFSAVEDSLELAINSIREQVEHSHTKEAA